MITLKIKKEYKDFILNIDIVLKEDITGIIGENGAGKTTIFKAMLDLIKYEGTVLVDGKKIEKEDVGVVFADSFFSNYLTINDLVKILKNTYKAFDELWYIKKVNDLDLPLNKPINTFSTGMKAKIKLITALSHHAKLLILDEVTLGLDVVTRDDVISLIREYVLENAAKVIISSHISTDLENLVDEFVMLSKGKVILKEDINTLLNNYALIKVTKEEYDDLDKSYVLKKTFESYGINVLTSEYKYYKENYPKLVVEKAKLDDIIIAFVRGE